MSDPVIDVINCWNCCLLYSTNMSSNWPKVTAVMCHKMHSVPVKQQNVSFLMLFVWPYDKFLLLHCTVILLQANIQNRSKSAHFHLLYTKISCKSKYHSAQCSGTLFKQDWKSLQSLTAFTSRYQFAHKAQHLNIF
jgi:hypothetical protein